MCGFFLWGKIMKADMLWQDGPSFYQDNSVFKIGTDALLLAKFVRIQGAKKLMDLGTGTGVLSVLLALSNTQLSVSAVDISPKAVALAEKNAHLNEVSAQINAQVADICHIKDHFQANAFDFVISNPPYFAANSGAPATGDIAHAREETLCSLDDICKAAAHLLRFGGNFALVHRPERLTEIFACMTKYNIEPKRIQFAVTCLENPPSLVFIEGKYGAKPGLLFNAPFLLEHTKKGG